MSFINKFGGAFEKTVTQGASTTLYCATYDIKKLKNASFFDNCNSTKSGVSGDGSEGQYKSDEEFNKSDANKLWKLSVMLLNDKGFKISASDAPVNNDEVKEEEAPNVEQKDATQEEVKENTGI